MHLPEAAAAPETAEDIFFPRSEEGIEEERSSFREEQVAEMPADVEAVSAEPAPAKKMDEFSESISDLSDRVGSISDAIDLLRQTVSDLKGEVKSLRGEIALTNLRADKGPELKDSQKLDELKREQKRISEFVTDIVDILHTIKEKKSWFKF
jgi:uncharacterized protein YaaR (DUF327 family)